MKIAVSAETTVDLTEELKNRFDVKTTPFTVLLGDREAFDGEISPDEIFSFVEKNKILPKTSAVNDYQYTEHFTNLLKDYDAVIHLSLSSHLSSACQNAKSAAEKLSNVFVVDTLSLSTGIALLAIFAREQAQAGLSPQEIYNALNQRVKGVQASFALKRVDYLYKGGRCSAMAYLGANLLGIRPQIILKDGKMIAGKKYRGNYLKVINNYCRDVIDEYSTPDLNHAFVTYTTADEQVVKTAVSYLEERGFKNIHVTRAGATISSHCGEDCLGILYLNDKAN